MKNKIAANNIFLDFVTAENAKQNHIQKTIQKLRALSLTFDERNIPIVEELIRKNADITEIQQEANFVFRMLNHSPYYRKLAELGMVFTVLNTSTTFEQDKEVVGNRTTLIYAYKFRIGSPKVEKFEISSLNELSTKLKGFKDFITDSIVIGQGVNFDLQNISKELRHLGLPRLSTKSFCTHLFAKNNLIKCEKLDLSSLCKFLSLWIDPNFQLNHPKNNALYTRHIFLRSLMVRPQKVFSQKTNKLETLKLFNQHTKKFVSPSKQTQLSLNLSTEDNETHLNKIAEDFRIITPLSNRQHKALGQIQENLFSELLKLIPDNMHSFFPKAKIRKFSSNSPYTLTNLEFPSNRLEGLRKKIQNEFKETPMSQTTKSKLYSAFPYISALGIFNTLFNTISQQGLYEAFCYLIDKKNQYEVLKNIQDIASAVLPRTKLIWNPLFELNSLLINTKNKNLLENELKKTYKLIENKQPSYLKMKQGIELFFESPGIQLLFEELSKHYQNSLQKKLNDTTTSSIIKKALADDYLSSDIKYHRIQSPLMAAEKLYKECLPNTNLGVLRAVLIGNIKIQVKRGSLNNLKRIQSTLLPIIIKQALSNSEPQKTTLETLTHILEILKLAKIDCKQIYQLKCLNDMISNLTETVKTVSVTIPLWEYTRTGLSAFPLDQKIKLNALGIEIDKLELAIKTPVTLNASLEKQINPKLNKLVQLLQKNPEEKVLIICPNKQSAKKIFTCLQNLDFEVGAYIGKIGNFTQSKKEQDQNLESFSNGKTQILVSTEGFAKQENTLNNINRTIQLSPTTNRDTIQQFQNLTAENGTQTVLYTAGFEDQLFMINKSQAKKLKQQISN